MVRKNVSLPEPYIEKIELIKEKLGVTSTSEVIRRAIDCYAEKLGVTTKERLQRLKVKHGKV